MRAAGGGTTFEPVPGVEPNADKWDELDGWCEAVCPASRHARAHPRQRHAPLAANPSDKTRMIYTFHMIEGGAQYDGKNWLRPTAALPFPALYDEAAPLPTPTAAAA